MASSEPVSPASSSTFQKEVVGPNSGSTSTLQKEVAQPKWWQRYIAVLGCFLLMFNSWGLVNSYGTFSSYYRQHLLPGANITVLNLVGSTQCFIVLSLSAVVGRLLDAGHHRTLAILGTVLIGPSYFVLSLVDSGHDARNYGLIFFAQGIVSAVGMACFFVPASHVASTWFERKSIVIGIVASGASIAGLIYPMMLKSLLPLEHMGFNNAVRCVAGVSTATSIVALLLARPNPATASLSHKKVTHWFRPSQYYELAAFKDPAFAWLTAGICFIFLGFYAVFFNLEEWAVVTGVGHRDSIPSGVDHVHEALPGSIRTFWLLCIMNASSTAGRIGSAWLGDLYGALPVHAVATAIASLLASLLWTFAQTPQATVAFVTLFGVFSGVVIGLPPASLSNILHHEPRGDGDILDQEPNGGSDSKRGLYLGMLYATAAPSALVGPIIAGYLINRYDSYLTVQQWSGACLFTAACCLALSYRYQRRQRQSSIRRTTIPLREVLP